MSDTLNLNVEMLRGQKIISQNGCYRFEFQNDGNACVIDKEDTPLWCSDTKGNIFFSPTKLVLEPNRLIIDSTGGIVFNEEIPNAHVLVMKNDGNLVVLDTESNQLWQTGTAGLGTCDPGETQTELPEETNANGQSFMTSNQYLNRGEKLINGCYTIEFQSTDGNIVLKDRNLIPRWGLGLPQGNLVNVNPDKFQLTHNMDLTQNGVIVTQKELSETPHRLDLQSNGNIEITNVAGEIIWQSETTDKGDCTDPTPEIKASPLGNSLEFGQSITRNEYLESPNGIYRFMLEATAAKNTRIKMWNNTTGDIIYDEPSLSNAWFIRINKTIEQEWHPVIVAYNLAEFNKSENWQRNLGSDISSPTAWTRHNNIYKIMITDSGSIEGFNIDGNRIFVNGETSCPDGYRKDFHGRCIFQDPDATPVFLNEEQLECYLNRYRDEIKEAFPIPWARGDYKVAAADHWINIGKFDSKYIYKCDDKKIQLSKNKTFSTSKTQDRIPIELYTLILGSLSAFIIFF
jgi:hypothetical protein